MFVVNHLGAWTKQCVEYFTTDSSDYPSVDELRDATTNALVIDHRLSLFRRQLKEQFPHHTDAIKLVDDVIQALRDDHGGASPYEALEFWSSKRGNYFNDQQIFANLAEKGAMVKIWERWNDKDRLREQFWDLDPFQKAKFVNLIITEEYVLRAMRCLQTWLQKRRAGHIY